MSRRFQFTLRAVLILTLGVACFFGGIRFDRERQWRESEAKRVADGVPLPPSDDLVLDILEFLWRSPMFPEPSTEDPLLLLPETLDEAKGNEQADDWDGSDEKGDDWEIEH